MRAVIANSLPAPLPKSAMPGATNPKIISGMMKERKPENIEEIVTNILTPHIGKNNDATIPATMTMITFGSKPIFNLKLIFVLSDY